MVILKCAISQVPIMALDVGWLQELNKQFVNQGTHTKKNLILFILRIRAW